MKKALSKWIEKNYGKRCQYLSLGCAACEVWLAFDRIFLLTQTEQYKFSPWVGKGRTDKHKKD